MAFDFHNVNITTFTRNSESKTDRYWEIGGNIDDIFWFLVVINIPSDIFSAY